MSEKALIYGRPKWIIDTDIALSSCPGCGHPIATRAILEAIDELGVGGNSICCGGIGCHGMAMHLSMMDRIVGAHGVAPATATALKRINGDDTVVFTVQGDGDCAAIGAGCLVNAAARGEKITVFMFNNSIYGTTGGQMAPTTILGQVTATTPEGRDADMAGYPLHVAEMLVPIKGVVYSARGSISTPANFNRTKKYAKTALQKQLDGKGFSYLEILSPCPVNLHMSPVDAMKWVDEKQVVEYPLGEFKNLD
jgi:2-oxoglutarate ferredoxin oxidoreductase subunit beta